jgi:hypothetical protein
MVILGGWAFLMSEVPLYWFLVLGSDETENQVAMGLPTWARSRSQKGPRPLSHSLNLSFSHTLSRAPTVGMEPSAQL